MNAETPCCSDPSCRRVRWALHVLLTLDDKGCGLRVADSLGLGGEYERGQGSASVWGAAKHLGRAALDGWTPEPPTPLPPRITRERCAHDRLPAMCPTCIVEKGLVP